MKIFIYRWYVVNNDAKYVAVVLADNREQADTLLSRKNGQIMTLLCNRKLQTEHGFEVEERELEKGVLAMSEPSPSSAAKIIDRKMDASWKAS